MNISFKDKFRLREIADQYKNLIMILVLNIPAIFFILLSNIKFVDFTPFQFVYLFSTIIGYYLLVLLLIISIVFVVFYPIKPLRIFLIGTIISFFIFYFLIDHFVYSIAKIHIDLFWFKYIIKDYQGFGLPLSTLRNALLVFVGIITVQIGKIKISSKIKINKFLVIIVLFIIVSGFAISQSIHIIAYEKNDSRITSITPHLPVYIPIISRRDAVKYGDLLPLVKESDQQDLSENASVLIFPKKELDYNPPKDFENPNILIIFLESWRFDAMNERVTPNIYELGLKSSVFNNHLSSGNSTVAGVFGFFYGLHPSYWTSVKANSVLIDNPPFIDLLKKNHYSFSILAKSNFNRHKIKDTVFRGIDVDESFAGNTIIEQDVNLTRKLKEFIRNQSEVKSPYMAFAFYKSCHFPYHYPKEDSIFTPAADINFILADDDTETQYYLNDYKNSVHYVDAMIGEILSEIDSLGGMENTIIIISTDHSDELNDNHANYWGHGSNFTKFQTMVPLVIYLPGEKPRLINYRTSHIDIMPTLMRDIYGCTNDIQDFSNGRYLFEESSEERPFVIGSYIHHAFVFGDNIYEIYPMHAKKYKLYDVNAEAQVPSSIMLKKVLDEISYFYHENDMDLIQ